MENIHKITTKNQGMVLITTLLILLAISLLATSLLKTSLMAEKINTLYQNKTKALALAIKKLQTLELNLAYSQHEGNTRQVITSIKIIDSGICGIDFYKITVSVEYGNAISKIQSIWAELNSHYSACAIKAEIRPGRQSFLIIK